MALGFLLCFPLPRDQIRNVIMLGKSWWKAKTGAEGFGETIDPEPLPSPIEYYGHSSQPSEPCCSLPLSLLLTASVKRWKTTKKTREPCKRETKWISRSLQHHEKKTTFFFFFFFFAFFSSESIIICITSSLADKLHWKCTEVYFKFKSIAIGGRMMSKGHFLSQSRSGLRN